MYPASEWISLAVKRTMSKSSGYYLSGQHLPRTLTQNHKLNKKAHARGPLMWLGNLLCAHGETTKTKKTSRVNHQGSTKRTAPCASVEPRL